jgi:hypothetical protein
LRPPKKWPFPTLNPKGHILFMCNKLMKSKEGQDKENWRSRSQRKLSEKKKKKKERKIFREWRKQFGGRLIQLPLGLATRWLHTCYTLKGQTYILLAFRPSTYTVFPYCILCSPKGWVWEVKSQLSDDGEIDLYHILALSGK